MSTQPLDTPVEPVDTSARKKYGKSIRWTPDLHIRFLQYVAEEVRKGHKKNNTLDKDGWAHVKDKFANHEKKITLCIDQLRNHFDKCRRLWQAWRYLATHTGLGWDEVNRTYTASDDFWEGFKKMYKDGSQLRWKGLSCEEEQLLLTIYGSSVATGKDRWNPSSGIIPPNEDELDLDEVDVIGTEYESTPTNFETNVNPNVEINTPPTEPETGTQPQLGTRPRASTSSSLPQPPRRRQRRSMRGFNESQMSRACDILEERTRVMERIFAPESLEQALQKTYNQSFELLESLPSFDPLHPMYTWAPSFLCKKSRRHMFIALKNTQWREAWLKNEFEKSAGSAGPAI